MAKNIVKQSKSVVVPTAKGGVPTPASPEGPSAERVAELLGGPVKGEPTPVKTPEVAKGEKTGKESGNTPKSTPSVALKSVPTPAVVAEKTPAVKEEKRPSGIHPFCVLPTLAVGSPVVVLVRGKILAGVVHAHSTGGRLVVGKIAGLKENLSKPVSYIFANAEAVATFRSWVKGVVENTLPVPPAGTKVATFDVSGDLGYDAVMYRGEVVGAPEESGVGLTIPVFYDWENTTDPAFPVGNLRDVVCVTDPLVNEYALAYVRSMHEGDKVSE